MFGDFTYLVLNLLVIAGPMVLQAFPRYRILHRWRQWLVAVMAGMVVMIPKDIWFTHTHIWGFNPAFVTGHTFLGLPIEEWLFFVTIPTACVFTYEMISSCKITEKVPMPVSISKLVLAGGGLVLLASGTGKWYTTSIALLFLGVVGHSWNKSGWFKDFLVSVVVLTPAFIQVNGVLTGMVNAGTEAVVWYNPDHITGIRFGSIPIEDWFYMYTLLYLNIWAWHYKAYIQTD